MARVKPSIGVANDKTSCSPNAPPVIFLLGPPGSGKTSIGGKACSELGLRFSDLIPSPTSSKDGWSAIKYVLEQEAPDVIALPWSLQQQPAVLAKCRVTGTTVVLWAHPTEMLARAGNNAAELTPRSSIRTKDRFGRLGTSCREFRSLDRASDHVLLLVGLSIDDAVAELKALLEELRLPESQDPAEREGLADWAKRWQCDHGADARASKLLVDAMARFTLHLKENEASPRTMSGVYSDLDAAAMLVMMYHAPKGKKVFRHFDGVPCAFEYPRKFSDSPNAVARYERNLRSFARFLRDVGLVDDG
jgi:hypothetical protein